ncbi:MAG: PEGA domain-containing protein [Sedimentisphaerales bacterium]|nr:PEGA domain-containing protein [Sedimentisphaerales bacterium]
MRKCSVWFIVVACLAALLPGGCVERKLTINTEPQGALVTLNDEQIGVSPVTVPFKWYGNYGVRLTKDGYETLDTARELKPPLHDFPPFDFVAQILYPGRIVDSYEWTFELQPREYPTREQVLKDAEALRSQLE